MTGTEDRIKRYVKAMEGIEVWVGFHDEAGDDDYACGTIDSDGLRALAHAVMAVVDAEMVAPDLSIPRTA